MGIRSLPAFNFMPHYAPLILEGSKTFTLRKIRRDFKPQASLGQTVGLFHGMRSPACVKFATAKIATRGRIRFDATGILEANDVIDLIVRLGIGQGPDARVSPGVLLSRLVMYPNGPNAPAWREQFARLDGFKSWDDFWTFHHAHHIDDDGRATREIYGFEEVKPA